VVAARHDEAVDSAVVRPGDVGLAGTPALVVDADPAEAAPARLGAGARLEHPVLPRADGERLLVGTVAGLVAHRGRCPHRRDPHAGVGLAVSHPMWIGA